VVLTDGVPVAYLERGGRSLVVFPSAEHHPGWAAAVAGIVGRQGGSGRSRLELARIDGEPAATSPHADALRLAGFSDGYRGLVLGGR
jgi:ATP-dependent Lhr-like helicase